MLLLHGLGASLATWSRNIDHLARKGFHAVAYLPGHGDSDKPKALDYNPVAAARFLDYFTSVLGIKRMSVVGSSAGGLIAGLFALQYPHKVDRMVLVAPGGMGRRISWVLRLVSLPVLGEILFQPWLQNRVGISKRIFYRAPPFIGEVDLEMNRVQSLPGARTATLKSIRSSINYRGLKSNRYILERLKDSKAPLMTVWGKEDMIIPVEHAGAVRRELPNSVIRIFPECGHWPHMEKADKFNELLVDYLRGGLDSAPPSEIH